MQASFDATLGILPRWLTRAVLESEGELLVPLDGHRGGCGAVGDLEGDRRETWVRFRLRRDGSLASEIAFRRENGRMLDESECARKNAADTRRRDEAPFRIDELPLTPSLQPLVRYRRLSTADGAVAFAFVLSRDGHAIAGTATLTPDGWPLAIEFEPRPLPPFVDSLRSTLRFARAADGGVRLDSMTVRGSAGALWIRRRFHTEYRFVDALPPLAPSDPSARAGNQR